MMALESKMKHSRLENPMEIFFQRYICGLTNFVFYPSIPLFDLGNSLCKCSYSRREMMLFYFERKIKFFNLTPNQNILANYLNIGKSIKQSKE